MLPHRLLRTSTFVGACCGIAAPVLAQSTFYVDDDALPGGSGTSWALAFDNLQRALFVAQAGDQIRVGEGTYRPDQGPGITPGDVTAFFALETGVALRGGYRGLSPGGSPDDNDPALFVSRLSGDLLGNDGPAFANRADNSMHVLRAQAVQSTGVIDGFEVSGGHADGDSVLEKSGGGLWSRLSAVTVERCTFRDNFALELGGGVYLDNGVAGQQTQLVECRLESNGCDDDGAALAVLSTSVRLESTILVDNVAGLEGGGIFASFAGLRLESSVVESNDGRSGGGIYALDSTVRLIGTSIRGNTAWQSAGGVRTTGTISLVVDGSTFENNVSQDTCGGLYLTGGVAAITGSRFVGNTAGPSFGHDGGGIFAGATTLRVRSSDFVGNQAFTGGGIAFVDSAPTHLIVENCRFVANVATNGNGGGLWTLGGEVRQCLFQGNTSLSGGGGLYAQDTAVRQCTVVGNETLATGPNDAGGLAGGEQFMGELPLVANTILWGNTSGGQRDQGAQISFNPPFVGWTLHHCCVEGLDGSLGGMGNLGADPQFADEAGGNLLLTGSSPCVDAADEATVPADQFDLDGDANVTEPLPFDLAGAPRFVDGPAPNTGAGTFPFADIGAFEFRVLQGDVSGVSLAAGGAQQLALDFGSAFAFDLHLLLGSASGTAPGVTIGGVSVPLNPDSYLSFTITSANSPFLVGTLGTLDAGGRATCQIVVPPGTLPSLAGVELDHAAVVLDLAQFGALAQASNAVGLSLAP